MTRSTFKYALRLSRRQEEQLRADIVLGRVRIVILGVFGNPFQTLAVRMLC